MDRPDSIDIVSNNGPRDLDGPATVQPILAPLCSVFRRYLKSQDLRYTTERADVLEAVMQTDGLFEADSLLDALRGQGTDVSKATVYRTLRLLQEAGIITPILLLGGKQTQYQLAYGRDAADFLVCVHSGEIKSIHSEEILALRDRIAGQAGWEAVGHRFVIYGVAPSASPATSDSSN